MNNEKEKQKQREHLLQKAKLQLMMKPDTIFFTSIMFSLLYKWDNQRTRTAAVDGRHMFINPQFFDSLTPEQRIGVFIHEVLHVALNHITRGMKHNARVSNEAADYVTNLIVLDSGFILPSNCLLDWRFKNMSYEQVYKILMEEKSQNPEMNTPGDPNEDIPGIGSDILPPADQAEADMIKSEITDIVFKATVAAKQAGYYGSIPGAILIELDKSLNPRLPWNVLFQNYMNRFVKDDYSWTKPSRRYLPDLIMPSLYSESIANVTVAVDCSGSVSNAEFGLFIQEIDVVQQLVQPEMITLITFNTKIIDVHEITQDINIMKDIVFTGRGGTDVKEVFSWAKENNPEILIVFTDGCFHRPAVGQYPDCPVIWLIHNNPNFTAEGGEIIHYEV